MKDLYLRLGVDESASDAAITARIGHVPPEDADDCRVILLDARRRTVYDKNLVVVRTIGRLRHRLSLADTDLWSASKHLDFLSLRDAPRGRGELRGLFRQRLAGLAFFSAAAAVFLISLARPSSRRSQENKVPRSVPLAQQRNAASSELKPTPYLQEVALPPTGLIRRYDKRRGVAPLLIVTPREAVQRIAKIVNADTGSKAATLFIRGGERVKILMPLGRYRIKIAAGSTWYGLKHLFGPRTRIASLTIPSSSVWVTTRI